jgi:phosphoribosylformylglycinamidine (FGAM) synthase PurS component
MPSEKNPCLSCELLDQDKNNPTCEGCKKRIEYVVAIGDMAYSVPVELTDLTAKKGIEMRIDAEKPQKTQTESKRICEKCGNNPTIHPNSKTCASCMAKLSHKKRKCPESAFKAGKTKEAAGSLAKPSVTPEKQKGAITIEFKSHVQILKEVEKLAEREMRPLDRQILYILKKYIEVEVQQCPG